jgi:hypothetical protein
MSHALTGKGMSFSSKEDLTPDLFKINFDWEKFPDKIGIFKKTLIFSSISFVIPGTMYA